MGTSAGDSDRYHLDRDSNYVIYDRVFMSDRSPEEIRATVLSKLAQFKRKSWKPLVREGEDIPASSKFGGTPVLCHGESWPLCGACQSPMRFFFQLDSQDLPSTEVQIFGNGILQLFYCSSYECDVHSDHPARFPFNPRVLVRIIDRDLVTSEVIEPKMTDPFHYDWKIEDNFFRARFIVDWEEIDDYANFIERERLEFYLNDYDDDFEIDDDEEYNLAHDLSYPKDKLSGWPDWCNGKELVECPSCQREMNFIFQLASEDNLPYCWGDVDNEFIFQCPEHREQITYIWGC